MSKSLSVLELKALQMTADGYMAKDVARELQYSAEYMKSLIYKIEIKLGADNKSHAVALAIRRGLIE